MTEEKEYSPATMYVLLAKKRNKVIEYRCGRLN